MSELSAVSATLRNLCTSLHATVFPEFSSVPTFFQLRMTDFLYSCMYTRHPGFRTLSNLAPRYSALGVAAVWHSQLRSCNSIHFFFHPSVQHLALLYVVLPPPLMPLLTSNCRSSVVVNRYYIYYVEHSLESNKGFKIKSRQEF